MNAVVQRFSIWLLALGLGLASTTASAYSYVMMEDANLFDTSEGVVVARVERSLPAADGDGETRYVLHVLNVLAGPKLAARETLVLPGTFDAPNLNLVIEGIPRIAPGSTILLFHARRHDGVLQAMQLSLGLFGRVETDEGAYYVRELEGEREFGKRAERQRYHAPRAAAPFERWLADRARGIRRAPDYLRGQIKIDSIAKFTFGIFTFGGANPPPPGPGRWFQFDTDQTMPWRAGPGGQANTTSDEFASLTQALAAWTNDPNSRILLTNAGTQADPPICNNPPMSAGNFSGHVCWNDVNNRVSGTFLCPGGGTLGIGGSFVSSNGQMFNGQTWYPRADAFVVINDGAGCFMDDFAGADGAELLTHEIGHSLAFGHSCGDGSSPACNTNVDLNQAVMRASAHGDGRGATLGVDDRAGAAVAYPQPGGATCTGDCVFRNGFE